MGPVTLLIFLRRTPTRMQDHGRIFTMPLPSPEKTVKRPRNLSATEKKCRKAKMNAVTFGTWLEATQDPTKIRQIEVKLSEGYYMKMISMWKLLDKEGR